jgi:hypothetical protein
MIPEVAAEAKVAVIALQHVVVETTSRRAELAVGEAARHGVLSPQRFARKTAE